MDVSSHLPGKHGFICEHVTEKIQIKLPNANELLVASRVLFFALTVSDIKLFIRNNWMFIASRLC